MFTVAAHAGIWRIGPPVRTIAPMGNGPTRAQPLMLITPVRRLWAVWLRLSWPPAEHVWPVRTITKRPLDRLRFIHFAHWGLLTRMPPRGGRRLPRPYIVFQTNFNGDANAYIDAFAILIPSRMRLLYQGAFGFPGPRRRGPLRRFVLGGAEPEPHFYCAYPDASVKMILSGLAVEEALEELRRAARAGNDAAFATRWSRFLVKHGNDL
ncbi:MAG: hypothetical protein JWM31_1702 [Solirubrobacterales bacterium]|nr:hypothetical protein [Solirubrobacterales bacterium]